MATASASEVKAALQKLLPTLDINSTTERQIRELLAQKLGPVEQHKKLIRQEVDDFLTKTLAADGGAGDADDADDFEAAAAAGSKRGRAPGAAAAGAKPAKEPRSAAELPGVQLDTQGLRFASISVFKGQPRVDIRNYFRAKDDSLAPTKKGISFSTSDWAKLQEALPQLTAAVQAGSTDFSHDLGVRNIRLQTSVLQGKQQASIREFYTDAAGELKPSLKGISLTPDQYETLVESLPELNKQLAAAGAAGPTAATAAAAPAARAAAPAAAAAARKPAGSKGGAAKGGDECCIELGNRKRAAISLFTGKPTVDLREMYEKDGQLLPGKKGISLRPEQWRKIVVAAADITAAHSRRDDQYRLELATNRQVSISSFKGSCYVNIREMYEKDGELKPSLKGLSLNSEQWLKLVGGMEELCARLG